ncbi:MAG: heme lyase CcmF/NrfE family subunit [Cardiobacteriaceae bacterium]|nr:heme lyase CcmF/NrfE family subunit [Cardiobacteriaceae bacterium]
MIIATGHYALWLAATIAFLQALLPFLLNTHHHACRLAVTAAKIQSTLLCLSMAALGYAFINNDFSVHYVAAHSNSLLPWYYRLTAIWGGHEGSLLLWVVILSLWTAALAWRSNTLPDTFRSKILAILGYISFGFILFIGLTSNPFTRRIPAPFDGADLNPLLQDPGLIFHPPLLYTGYVGFAIAFAFVVAGLWQGQLNALWLRRVRPWTLAAWLTLTLGIALGSYWAYYELGWGGWWFWDPVENASLMPWLIGTALLHSLIVSEKRGIFKIWTALLAIIAFSLSLIGTFLVRSGILTSVHAFAADPTRGIFILMLLIAITLPALILLILRAPHLSHRAPYTLLSRESGILLNNWLLAGACLIVFTGTLYPLIADLFHLGKISVGAPYYNRLIVPLALLSLALLGIAPLLRWQHDGARRLKRQLLILLMSSAVITLTILSISNTWQSKTILAVLVASLATSAILIDHIERIRHRVPSQSHHLGMTLAHLGYIITTLGITATGLYSNEQDLSIKNGQSVDLANYHITLIGLQKEQGPNYTATQGKFLIQNKKDNRPITVLIPSKRQYYSSTMPMTESARLITPTHDLYIALGEAINDNTWAIRLQYKPYIIWIWLGAVIMALGGCIAALDRRYRKHT